MFCRNCGKELEENIKFCPHCGTSTGVGESKPVESTHQDTDSNSTVNAKTNTNESSVKVEPSEKSRLITALFAFFLGSLGIHRFYVGRIGTGILYVLLSFFPLLIFVGWWGFFISEILAIIDLVMICCGEFKNKDKRPIKDWKTGDLY